MYIDIIEHMFYNMLKEFRSGLCRKELKVNDYEKMELCRELARRILNIRQQFPDIEFSSSLGLVSIPNNQDSQPAEEAHYLRA